VGEPSAEALERALGSAYRYLGHRDRSERELRAHLARKGVEPGVAEAVLATLVAQGYLDDARFARRLAADRRTLDGWGAERVERALDRAGVAPHLAEAALAERSAEDELAAAVALLERRLATPPADDRARQRALGLLVRRGYELELAHDALRAFARGERPGS
jgi:regulatory protein